MREQREQRDACLRNYSRVAVFRILVFGVFTPFNPSFFTVHSLMTIFAQLPATKGSLGYFGERASGIKRYSFALSPFPARCRRGGAACSDKSSFRVSSATQRRINVQLKELLVSTASEH
jgi:hypothetical protein